MGQGESTFVSYAAETQKSIQDEPVIREPPIYIPPHLKCDYCESRNLNSKRIHAVRLYGNRDEYVYYCSECNKLLLE